MNEKLFIVVESNKLRNELNNGGYGYESFIR